MKVLQINAVIQKGSTGIIARDIGNTVVRFNGTVYYASQEKVQESNTYCIGSPTDYKLHALYCRLTGLQGYASRISTRKLLQWITDIRPDIIHLHNIHNNYINLPMLFSYIRKKQIHTVITLHDSWMMTGKCMHFLKYGCSKWKTGCYNCVAQKKEIPSLFVDNAHKVWVDRKKYIGDNPFVHIVGCSNWITEATKESVLKDRVIGTVYNGIDLKVFRPCKTQLRQKLGIEGKYVMLGMANKWLAQENDRVFQNFTAGMQEEEVLVLVGCSKEQMGSLRSGVIGLPFVSGRSELAECYAMADVFINVTKVDTFPTVNLEALACGTPVITFNSGGAGETIDRQTGIVVPYGDALELRRALDTIKAGDREMQREYCQKRAQTFFNRLTNYDTYIEIYKQLMLNA